MKNKIISILCIIILISFTFITNVFAYTESSEKVTLYISDEAYELLQTFEEYKSGDYYYWVMFDGTYYYYHFFKKEELGDIYFISNYGIRFQSSGNISSVIVYNCLPSNYVVNGPFIWSDKKFYTNFSVTSEGYFNYLVNFTVYTDSSKSDIFFEPKPVDVTVYPAIQNTAEDLSTGTFDYIGIHPGTFSNTEDIGLNIYDITNLEEGDDVYSQTPLFSTTLTSSSSYYKSVTVEDVTEFWYEIPRGNLNINFKNGNTYLYSLIVGGSPIQEIQSTVGGLTKEDILNNSLGNLQGSIVEGNKELQQTITESNKELQSSIDNQTQAIEESNKTNKNIFEKIGEILSYLNPFSENFFAYKLVELIVDGLKSLFIPADDFFSLYFDELNDWFSDRLGFLYYPLELLFDLLDRFLNIDFAEPIINIPDIKEPFTNVTLIKSISFNFNDLLSNETLKNVHDIYFIIVDAVIYIGLVTLLYRKYEEVMTK